MKYHFSKNYLEPKNKYGGWISFFGWQLVIKSTAPLFSERNGITKYYPIGFGYRIRIQKAPKP